MSFPELEALEEEKKRSYDRFEEHGEEFIDVFDDGVPKIESHWTSAEEIYEASDESREVFDEKSGNRIFTSIYNLLCDAEILEAFHNSPPYEINTEKYDKQTLVNAWEQISGENYGHEGNEEAVLKTKDLYETLKD